MDNPTPTPDPPPFIPNRVEKTLGWIGAVTVAPLLVPMLPLVGLLVWTSRRDGQARTIRTVKVILAPVAVSAVFLMFFIICVLAIPYGAIYFVLRQLNLVRKPPEDQLEEETDGVPPAV